jgi:hypothetical protein
MTTTQGGPPIQISERLQHKYEDEALKMQDEWEQQHSLCEHRRYDSGAGREYFENCADDRQKIDIRSGQALEVESNNTVFRLSSFASIWDLFLHTSQADVYSEDNFMAFSGFECNFQLSSC